MRTSQADREETPSERADRNYAEIVQELRVAQTGVQILFAFLLALTFQSAFPRDDRTAGLVLTAALLLAASAAVCFMAPVIHHRRTFRQGRKKALVWHGHWMALSGLILLVASMVLSVWLVMSVLWTARVASVTAGVMLGTIVVLWLVLPPLIARPGRRSDG